MQEHPLLGGRVEREAGESAGTLLMAGRKAPKHDLIHPGTLPGNAASPEDIFRLHGRFQHRVHGRFQHKER